MKTSGKVFAVVSQFVVLICTLSQLAHKFSIMSHPQLSGLVVLVADCLSSSRCQVDLRVDRHDPVRWRFTVGGANKSFRMGSLSDTGEGTTVGKCVVLSCIYCFCVGHDFCRSQKQNCRPNGTCEWNMFEAHQMKKKFWLPQRSSKFVCRSWVGINWHLTEFIFPSARFWVSSARTALVSQFTLPTDCVWTTRSTFTILSSEK